jgi:hypothetical protein
MKKKYSNLLFFSYLTIILLVSIATLIYVKIYLQKFSPQQLKHLKTYYDISQLKKIPAFDVAVITNQAQVSLIQSDSFAASIPIQKLKYSNDTIFISENKNLKISFKKIKSIITKDNSQTNIVSLTNQNFTIDASDNSIINILGVNIFDLNINAIDNAQFNIATSKIKNLNINLKGRNQINIAGRIENLQGYLANTSSVNAFPKPKNININNKNRIH